MPLIADGIGLTVNVTVPAEKLPLPSVTVTVYVTNETVPVVTGVAVTTVPVVADKLTAGAHV